MIQRWVSVFAAACLAANFAWAAAKPGVEAFGHRVRTYMKIREAALHKVPGLPKSATPEQIEQHETALVAEIRARRAGAKQGDVFVPEVQPLFRKILKENLAGPENK